MRHNLVPSPTTGYSLLHLEGLFNNDAISYDSNRGDADPWLYGVAYPAEELPRSRAETQINQIPFFFPAKEDGHLNNFTFAQQTIDFDALHVKRIYFLCSGDYGNYIDDIGVQDETNCLQYMKLGISSWLVNEGVLGAQVGIRTTHVHDFIHGQYIDFWYPRTMWVQSISPNPQKRVTGLSFPDNPFAHIFAITIQTIDEL